MAADEGGVSECVVKAGCRARDEKEEGDKERRRKKGWRREREKWVRKKMIRRREM